VGYAAGVRAYRDAVASLDVSDLTEHYTRGLGWFHDTFAPRVRDTLTALTGGAWDLSSHDLFAAGSDVDLMAHVVESAHLHDQPVRVFPGDWYGFRVGSSRPERVVFSDDAHGSLACACLPSVRNGHVTRELVSFLRGAELRLLNINLFPTLAPAERRAVAAELADLLPRSLVSVSFSRGFGLTASQLGVLLAPRDHLWTERARTQLDWFTYFHNALAARAFARLDLDELARVDALRREEVSAWLRARGLPVVETGSYYVRSFRVDGDVPPHLAPLARDGVVRLCFKPAAVGDR
jgi:hypothetical protein